MLNYVPTFNHNLPLFIREEEQKQTMAQVLLLVVVVFDLFL